MAKTSRGANEVISFVRKRDYRLVRELGQGACGKTVLLYDDQIDELFVCKKYAPYSEAQRAVLFNNFLREIKLLHKLHHPNVVRVFNYYLYPEALSGYILMEFVDGPDIEDYIREHPEQVNEVFIQSVTGFSYLERSGILHRDVRPGNLLVDKHGHLKIIDLGFGKEITGSVDFDKSVTLNWWCELPSEFQQGRYDFGTEVYFVGKLFESIIQENDIQQFQFTPTLSAMCRRDPGSRLASFVEIEKIVQSGKLFEIGFSDDEMEVYRAFADSVSRHVMKIEAGAKYVDDPDRVQAQLNDAYRSCMLEQTVPDASIVLNCLISGTYYLKRSGFPVVCLREFIKLLKSSTLERNRILLANLHTRLDAKPRYAPHEITDDDVPF